jgi:hypothetical protein
VSGVAYRKLGAILATLVAPNPAPKKYSDDAAHDIGVIPHNLVSGLWMKLNHFFGMQALEENRTSTAGS